MEAIATNAGFVTSTLLTPAATRAAVAGAVEEAAGSLVAGTSSW